MLNSIKILLVILPVSLEGHSIKSDREIESKVKMAFSGINRRVSCIFLNAFIG